jgi:hypothetical protein
MTVICKDILSGIAPLEILDRPAGRPTWPRAGSATWPSDLPGTQA